MASIASTWQTYCCMFMWNNAEQQQQCGCEHNCGTHQLTLHSMFSQVDVSFNGNLISSSTDMHPYTKVFKMQLSYRANTKKLQLTSELYYRDDWVTWSRHCLQLPELWVRHDRTHPRCHLPATLPYLLNGVGIKLRLVRSKDAFCLMGAPDNVKLHILTQHSSCKSSSCHCRCFLHTLRWWKMARQNIPQKEQSAKCSPFCRITET